MNKKFDLFVSLGAMCSCTQALRDAGLQHYSYPFDWVGGSNLYNRCLLLENNFKDFITKEDLVHIGSKDYDECREMYKSTKNDLIFVHDFSYKKTLDEEFYKVLKKYNRRATRLIEQIESSKKVCFVYVQAPDNQQEISEKELVDSYNVLANRFSSVTVNLIYLFNKNGSQYKETNIDNNENILYVTFDYNGYNVDEAFCVNEYKMEIFFRNYRKSLKHRPFNSYIIPILNNIFSVRNKYSNEVKHKIITILGIKMKFRVKNKKLMRKRERESLVK